MRVGAQKGVFGIYHDYVSLEKIIKCTISENIEGDVELNQKILYEFNCSKGGICNVFGNTKGNKLKLLDNVEEDVTLNQNTLKYIQDVKRVYLFDFRNGYGYQVETFREC
jgi:hypothetical protein